MNQTELHEEHIPDFDPIVLTREEDLLVGAREQDVQKSVRERGLSAHGRSSNGKRLKECELNDIAVLGWHGSYCRGAFTRQYVNATHH